MTTTDMQAELKRIASELLSYNPAADEYKGEHIHKVWAREIEALLACRPDAQADERYDLLQAAVNCPHEIESNRVVLHYSDKQPGHNALAQLSERLSRATAPLADERGGWRTGAPLVSEGKCREFIIAVRRAQSKEPGKVFVFSANYANKFTDDGCLSGRDGDEFIADGWFLRGLDTSGEFNEVYESISLNDGDEIVGWQQLPKWQEDRAAAPQAEEAQGVPVAINLEGLREKLLAPRQIVRDEDGWLTHPDFPICDEDVRADKLLEALRIESNFVSMESDVSYEAYEEYHESGAPDCSSWTPTPPAGNGWLLLEIYDTEDGPYALFGRDAYTAEQERKKEHTRKLRADMEWVRADKAAVSHPVCETCKGSGMIGGPSFYAPDEGGVPCPDCAFPSPDREQAGEAQARKVTVARMGHGVISVGECFSPELNEPGIVFLSLEESRVPGTDTTDVYPEGVPAPAESVLAYISFANPASIDQTIDVLSALKSKHWPDASPSRENGERQGAALSDEHIEEIKCSIAMLESRGWKGDAYIAAHMSLLLAPSAAASAPTLSEPIDHDLNGNPIKHPVMSKINQMPVPIPGINTAPAVAQPQAAEPKGLTDEQIEAIVEVGTKHISDKRVYAQTQQELRALLAKGE